MIKASRIVVTGDLSYEHCRIYDKLDKVYNPQVYNTQITWSDHNGTYTTSTDHIKLIYLKPIFKPPQGATYIVAKNISAWGSTIEDVAILTGGFESIPNILGPSQIVLIDKHEGMILTTQSQVTLIQIK